MLSTTTQASSSGARWTIPAAAIAATAGLAQPSSPTGGMPVWALPLQGSSNATRPSLSRPLLGGTPRNTLGVQTVSTVDADLGSEDTMRGELLSERADEVLRIAAVALVALSTIIGGIGMLIDASALNYIAVATLLLATFLGTAVR